MLASPAPIDGKRAYGYLKQICEIGPHRRFRSQHPPAQAGRRSFHKNGRSCPEQPFRAVHPLTGKRVSMANLIGSWYPDRLQRIVIGATTTPGLTPTRKSTRTFKLPFLAPTTEPRVSPC